MTPQLAAILDEMGVQEIPTTKRREPMETRAVNTLDRILRTRGEKNLRETLISIVETTNHKRELVAPIIWAMSDILLAHPAWFERGEQWLAAIDAIDLAELHAEAKANRRAVPPRRGIASALHSILRREFDPVSQERLI